MNIVLVLIVVLTQLGLVWYLNRRFKQFEDAVFHLPCVEIRRSFSKEMEEQLPKDCPGRTP
jgi:hypothetical protein